MKYATHRQEILEVCKRLHAAGWLAACDGNVSIRPLLSDGSPADEILITPAQRPKAFISVEEISILSLDGTPIEGKPSSEAKMHLEVYRAAPLARAVVHAHPPTSIAWSIARPNLSELPSRSCSELILALGRVPFVPYARPGTLEMGKNLTKFLPKSRALILRNHGTLTWGESLEEAYFGTERLEHSARLLKYATEIAGGEPLPELPLAEIEELEKLRALLGDKIL
jgi:L-fuculose-phosphate aldolase